MREYPSRLTSRSQWSVHVLIVIAVWQSKGVINLCDVPFSIIVVFVSLARGFSRLSCLQSILTASIIHFHGLSQWPASLPNRGLEVHKKASVRYPKKPNVERSMESPVGWKKVELLGTTQRCLQLSCSLSFAEVRILMHLMRTVTHRWWMLRCWVDWMWWKHWLNRELTSREKVNSVTRHCMLLLRVAIWTLFKR